MDYKMKSNDDDGSDSNLGNYTDNNGNNQNKITNNNGLSKAELRKSNKPIMEKRRRARINHCLNELKSLILEAMQKDPARHTKLEKADILEMTVKHLQSIQRQQFSMQIQTDPTVIYKFKTGFTDCAEEVNRYIGQLDSIDTATRQRLSNHLNNCATGIDKISTFNNFATTYPRTATTSTTLGFPNQLSTTNSIFHQTSSQDINNNNNNLNNNTRINMGGVQLIPSRLPSGELALIMPNTNQMSASSSSSSFFMPTIPSSTQQQHQTLDFMNTFPRLSAFTKPSINNINLNNSRPTATQTTNSTVTSPPLSPVSSISSLGCDDSIMMHTSSDFISKTPPPHLDNSSNLSDSFSTTPSSSESSTIKFISRTRNLQQSHVSSTSETTSSSSLSSIRIKNDTNFLRKRSRSDDCQNKLNESTNSKLIKLENQDDKNGNISREQNCSFDESNDSMWRPW